MPDANRAVDSLGLFLTGGASNKNPDLSLGGAVSTTRVRGMGAIVNSPIPAIRIDNVFPACGEGDAVLQVDVDGNLTFTPPGSLIGSPVAIAAGESKVITGSDRNKAVRVFRESGLPMSPAEGKAEPEMLNPMNGVLAMSNVTHAQRAAGVVTYRAFMLTGQATDGVVDLKLWLPPVRGSQALYAIATETPVSGAIQTIPNETTAPGGVSWVSPRYEADALFISAIPGGGSVGLWVRRTFPVGHVSPLEQVQLAMKFKGA